MNTLDTRSLDLGRLNSATKYPSIPTYHTLGDRGALLEEHIEFLDHPLIYTEKVDGTNSRIILMPDSCYVMGSREELLNARGDLVHNPALGIVETLRETAEKLSNEPRDTITVLYLETYGGKITGASKNYTGQTLVGYRLFDACRIDAEVLNREPLQIAGWREAGGQAYFTEFELQEYAEHTGLLLAPRIAAGARLPESIADVHTWLESAIPKTLVALDDTAKGVPEGIVVRTPDRQRIAKIRFEDYQRHRKRLS